VSLTFRPAE